MEAGRLFLCSGAGDEWVGCPPDEIIWLDRSTLSGNEDLTLHRAPRCAGLRYVQHRWELFSRDTTYQVYLAPLTPGPGGAPLSAEAVRRTARHVLPTAPESYEARPVVLEPGSWAVSVADWVRAVAGVKTAIESMIEGRCSVEGDMLVAACVEPMFGGRCPLQDHNPIAFCA